MPAGLGVHVVLDNDATHKAPPIQRWRVKHPRFVPHCTPTSASCLNLVERWFGKLTTDKLLRSAYRSVADLEANIWAWAAAWNDHPRLYVWVKTAGHILAALASYGNRIHGSGPESPRPGHTVVNPRAAAAARRCAS